MILCDEIIYVTEIASTNMTNTTNSVSTNASNSNNKKLRYKMDCDILHTVLLVIIFLFINAIIWYHYAKHKSKLKETYCRTKDIEIEKNEF